MNLVIVFLTIVFTVPAKAAVSSIQLNTQNKVPSQRWLLNVNPPKGKFEPGDVKKGTLDLELAQIKVAAAQGEFKKCWQQSQNILSRAKEIEPWIVLTGLQCGISSLEGDKTLVASIEKEVRRVQTHAEWMYQGPYAAPLRSQVIEALLALVDHDLKNKRKMAWNLLDQLFRWLQYMSNEQRAAYYSLLGDLTFVEQKWTASLEYFKKSLAQREDINVQKKIDKLKAELKKGKEKEKELEVEKKTEELQVPVATVEVPETLPLEMRMLKELKAGNLGSAVETATEVLQNSPEGKSGDLASQKLIEILFLVLEDPDIKYQGLRDKVIGNMESCQADRLGRWAKLLYGRGQYQTSYRFAAKAVNRLEGVANILEFLELAALSASHIGSIDEAMKTNKKIIEKFAGTLTARDATFRLGLESYRKQEFAQAIKYFEAYVGSTAPGENLNNLGAPLKELNALYWKVRSLQKLHKMDIADAAAEELMKKYPVSYYGIILRNEKTLGNFQFPYAPEAPVQSEYWLIGEHEKGWKRLQMLLSAGWLEEAQSELKNLPAPTYTTTKLAMVKYYASAMDYSSAVRWVVEAWDENEKFRQKSLLKLIFPRDYFEPVEQFAKMANLDAELVLSLIRQESAFSTKAVSRSGALGLMQLMPATADEVARDLSFKSLKIPEEVFNPKINIQMGSYYLAKMIRKYNGQIPFALAAYNAGPTRLDRWLGAKGVWKEFSEKKSWTPDDDLWIDELPWSETSHYVKAILRNLVVYRSLKTEQPQNLAFPFWKALE
ncbi:MAG: hypothetical protein A4S09_02905 [Proteobacteria bacterium SG_bin7]|nr:MAG: hypothetical protein A4S09_02905 [Proteobacteria bacterium SG_bin7]